MIVCVCRCSGSCVRECLHSLYRVMLSGQVVDLLDYFN